VGSPPSAEPVSWWSTREARVEQQQPGHGQVVWVGIDVGKHAHHAAAVAADGRLVWSRRVANDQAAIQGLIGQATAAAAGVRWAVDSTGSSAVLLLALLAAADQPVVYVPGRVVNRMAGAFAGEAKTDPKDALVIAQTARMRQDLLAARPRPELVAELAVLVGHRTDLMAEVALAAAAAQRIRLPAQDLTARLIAELASDLLGLDRRIKELDKTIGQRLASHPQARIICSLPGMGPLLAAELLAAVGDLGSFPDAGHLAAYAGLAPVPRDSGRRTNNLYPPKRYNRRLRRVFYLSALSSLSTPGPSRDYYRRKRAQGRRHQQALIALARRRVDVLWALLRDNRCFEPSAPIKTTTA
jgi:transposase